jgi:hypothetical protein
VGVQLRRSALLVLTLITVLVIRVTLTLSTHHSVTRFVPRRPTRIAHPLLAQRMSAAVSSVSRFVPGASCLTQALSLQFLLACRGYKSDVKIGVKRGAANKIEAHSWLMSGGVVIVGGTAKEIEAYVPLTELTARRR